MATFPVEITQEENIDLTMEAMDSNKTDKSFHAKAETSHHGKNNTNHHESNYDKKLSRMVFMFFNKIKYLPLKKIGDKKRK